jgi:hypothetical protein
MSLGLRADPTNTSGVISVAGVDQVVITNASNVVATTFTGALAGNASTATKLSTSTGAAPVYGARAWVSFDATRNVAGVADLTNTNRFIYASGNVTNVERLGQGDFVINFAIAMPDAFYTVNYTANGPVNGQHVVPFISSGVIRSVYSTTQVAISCYNVTNSAQRADPSFNSVVVFR